MFTRRTFCLAALTPLIGVLPVRGAQRIATRIEPPQTPATRPVTAWMTRLWNDLAKQHGPIRMHFTFGSALYDQFASEQTCLTREVPGDVPSPFPGMVFKTGTVTLIRDWHPKSYSWSAFKKGQVVAGSGHHYEIFPIRRTR